MDKRNIMILRECNQIPFAIVSWFTDPHEISIDPENGNIIEAEALLKDEYGFYYATIWKIERHKDKCEQYWRVKEVDMGKKPEKGLHMTG